MGDLYERIEQIEHVRTLLTKDMDALRPLFETASIAEAPTQLEQASRRSYVRAFFALVEALTEQYCGLLVDLAEARFVVIDTGSRSALSDSAYEVLDTGGIRTRPLRLPIKRKLRLLYRVAPEALQEPVDVRFDGSGWAHFGDAISMRDALMHPKCPIDCFIDEPELETVDSARAWHLDAHNRLVHAFHVHRGKVHW